MRWGLLVGALLVIIGCRSSSPTSPSQPPSQFAGNWNASSHLDSITGGDCAAAALQQFGLIGANNDFRLVFTQTGTTLTATSTSFGGGPTCSWSGTAGTNTVTLNSTQCTVGVLRGVRCASGAARDVQFVSSRITAAPNAGGTIWSGSEIQTYNELVGGSQTSVGMIVFTSRFNMNRS